MMFISRFLEIDHWKKWFNHSVRCVDRVTVGCLYTVSLLSVENKEINKLVLSGSRKTQE
jgi:hypothetical protein